MVGPALGAGDVSHVLQCLQAALQPSAGVQKQAEAALAALEERPGFCSCLAEIMQTKHADHSARWLASVQLKNTISKHWRSARQQDPRALTSEEKAHLRSRLAQLIVQDDNQVAVQVALTWAKVARQDYPGEWPGLFADLLVLLGDPGATQLAVRRTLLVVHHTTKELASKRLAADQRAFAQVAAQLFPPMWSQWFADTSTLLSGLPAVFADGASPTPGDVQGLLVTLERWLMLLKVLRRLLVFGYPSDFKSLKPVQEISVCGPAMLQALQQLVAVRPPGGTKGANGGGSHSAVTTGLRGPQRHQLITMLERGILKLAKVLVGLQDAHPWSFHAYGLLLPMTALCCDQLLAHQSHGGGMAVASSAWDRYLIQCMTFLINVSKCPAYRGKSAGGADLKAEDGQDAPVRVLVAEVRTALDGWWTADRLTALTRALITGYCRLTARDLEEWASESETFYHQGDVSGWQEHVGLAAEALFLVLLQAHPTLLCPLVIQLLAEASAACPLEVLTQHPHQLPGPVITVGGGPQPLTIPHQVLSVDAVLGAVALASYELHDYLPYTPWLQGTLLPILSAPGPVLRVLRRRVLRVVAACVARLQDTDRPAVYGAVLTCMTEDDPCLQLTSVACLHALVDDWNFSEQGFEPYVGSSMQALLKILGSCSELDSQTQAFNLLNLIIERMGDLIRPWVEPLGSLLPGLWAAAEGQSLLRIQVLLAVQRLVNVLGVHSPTLYPLLLPLLQYATDPGQPEALHLLEDGLGLWLVALRNAPGPTHPLLALLPCLPRVLSGSTEHIAVAMALVTSAALMARDQLVTHAQEVNAVFELLIGGVNERGMLLLLPALETVLAAAPAVAPHLRPALAKMAAAVLGGQESTQVQAYACCVLARLLLSAPAEFPAVVSAVGGDQVQQLGQLLDSWWESFDALSQPRQRKLSALGLCALLAHMPAPPVLAGMDASLACITGVWADLEGGPPQGGGDDSAAVWAAMAAADSGCEALLSVAVASEDAEGETTRRQQLRGSDPLALTTLQGALQQALEAARAKAGPAVDAALSTLDPTIVAQLHGMLTAPPRAQPAATS